ncbi:FGGY-family carbohydrate kinase [Cohnella silvisoli]|uniref:FGGY-family carbohydrate kinase n=1 Tax=Cohnella silvisoli TaxID=2873699 RepID=A0ABV1KNZ0_9BACL|nr:FGGY-family carbohydrate kinase [Cohnella silvisoli]MCD9020960.1 FGGY-family carbohydrate kinase [Cohnella silvisoli]
MNRYALGIDIGTTSVKAILISDRQEIVYETSAAHDLISEHIGWAEERTEDWWNNTITVIRRIVEEVPDAASRIDVIGVSGMVPAIVLLDKNGRPVRNSIQQNDARSVKEIEWLKQRIDQQQLFQATGGYTNQQHVLPRLLWLKANEPETWNKSVTIMGSYDYITYKLTDTPSIEVNWAVESGLYDIYSQAWLTEQMKSYGINPSMFPKVRLSGDIVGTLTKEAATLTGLAKDIPIVAGSADHVASTLAAGIVDEGDLLIKFGGAGDILYCTNEVRTTPELFYDRHVVPDKHLMNGCMSSSGSLVKWYIKDILNEQSDDIFKELDAAAEKTRPGSDGLIILPYFLGEKTPLFDPEARGVLFGLTLSHGRGHIFRAILEAVIYGFRHHVEVLAQQGYHPKRIFATNGGAKSKFWCQIAADVLKSEIRSFPSHPGSALGVAFLAGISTGLFSDWSQIHGFLNQYRDFKPIPSHMDVYDKTYQIYRDLYRQLLPSFHDVNQIY